MRIETKEQLEKYRESFLEKAQKKGLIEGIGRCENCGRSNRKLVLHHLSYKDFSYETGKGLKVLCERCHLEAHSDVVAKLNRKKEVMKERSLQSVKMACMTEKVEDAS